MVVEDRWSLNSSGCYHDFDCIIIKKYKQGTKTATMYNQNRNLK